MPAWPKLLRRATDVPECGWRHDAQKRRLSDPTVIGTGFAIAFTNAGTLRRAGGRSTTPAPTRSIRALFAAPGRAPAMPVGERQHLQRDDHQQQRTGAASGVGQFRPGRRRCRGSTRWLGGNLAGGANWTVASGASLVLPGRGAGGQRRDADQQRQRGAVGQRQPVSNNGGVLNNATPDRPADRRGHRRYNSGAVPTLNNLAGATLRKSAGTLCRCPGQFVRLRSTTARLDAQSGVLRYKGGEPVQLTGTQFVASGTNVHGGEQQHLQRDDHHNAGAAPGVGQFQRDGDAPVRHRSGWGGNLAGRAGLDGGLQRETLGTARAGRPVVNSGTLTNNGSVVLSGSNSLFLNNGRVFQQRSPDRPADRQLASTTTAVQLPTLNNLASRRRCAKARARLIGAGQFVHYAFNNSGTLDAQKRRAAQGRRTSSTPARSSWPADRRPHEVVSDSTFSGTITSNAQVLPGVGQFRRNSDAAEFDAVAGEATWRAGRTGRWPPAPEPELLPGAEGRWSTAGR